MSQSDAVTWRPLVSFPDQTANFVHGFEAGMIWQRMRAGEQHIDAITVHAENREVLQRMADAEGYEAAFFTITDCDEWLNLEMSRRPRRGPLSVVK